ncbi:MAG: endolytic transglycosylase MltG [Deltaproteobacteria bacterium]|nr:endolytic transglycosylase MltG [Deltaproteobacteria bacterium]
MRVRAWLGVVFLIFLTAVLAFMAATAFLRYAESPVDPAVGRQVVEVPQGASFERITSILEDAGLVKDRRAFYVLALIEDVQKRVKAGEYELYGTQSPRDILESLVEGRVRKYHVTVPEGFTLRGIAGRLAAAGVVDERRFRALAADKDLLSSLDIDNDTAEGFLFPTTYTFTKSMNEEDIIRHMAGELLRRITPDMRAAASDRGLTLKEIVTLASIIEKEGGVKEEKPLISAVFHNRLKKGMKLQSDPTVIYGIEDFDGNLQRRHLKMESPYNTYLISGLPPGPICSPGLDSIQAALNPSTEPYLYFVSKGDGTHHFSSSLTEHSKAVQQYQLRKKK